MALRAAITVRNATSKSTTSSYGLIAPLLCRGLLRALYNEKPPFLFIFSSYSCSMAAVTQPVSIIYCTFRRRRSTQNSLTSPSVRTTVSSTSCFILNSRFTIKKLTFHKFSNCNRATTAQLAVRHLATVRASPSLTSQPSLQTTPHYLLAMRFKPEGKCLFVNCQTSITYHFKLFYNYVLINIYILCYVTCVQFSIVMLYYVNCTCYIM